MKPAGKGQDAFWERVASRVADHRVVVIFAYFCVNCQAVCGEQWLRALSETVCDLN